jgi:hypothetical protein
MTPKAQATKAINNRQVRLHQRKFCKAKETINTVKKCTIDRE